MGSPLPPPAHPYAPQSLHLPGFVPSLLSPTHVLSLYLFGLSFVLLPVWFFTGRIKGLCKGDRVLACIVSAIGFNHLVVEAYILFVPHYYQSHSPTLLPEIWKLFSLADSRYLVRHPFLISMEAVLVPISGPMALISVYGIVLRKSWSYPLLLVFSTNEISLAGTTLISTFFEEHSHSASHFYFWLYYVFFTVLYGIAIPLVIGVMSLKQIDHIISLYNQYPKKDH